MINYSGLPGRVRRIAKTYAYCIEDVAVEEKNVSIRLKEGYKAKEEIALTTQNMEDAIYFLKSVSSIPVRRTAVAQFSFQCQLGCGNMIQRGHNYIDLGGMKICNYCGLI
jgi:hypothetical protein